MTGPGTIRRANGALAEGLSAVASEVGGGGRLVGVPYATNAALYAAAGVPAVLLGPGFFAQAHSADEWVPLDQLYQATEILRRFCLVFAHSKSLCPGGS